MAYPLDLKEIIMEKGSDLIFDISRKLHLLSDQIFAFADSLLDAELSAEQDELLRGIHLLAKSWVTVTNNFFDLSRISVGRLFLSNEPFNLHQCVKEVQDLLLATATEKGRCIIYLIDSSVPTIFVGDMRWLYQILVNLLNYALEFTSRDQIVLSVRGDEASSQLHFTIEGLVIQQSHVDSLYSFSSATKPYLPDWNERLILALSKRLAEMMGGTLGQCHQGAVYFTVFQGISNVGKPPRHPLTRIGQRLIEPINLTYTYMMVSMSAQLLDTFPQKKCNDFAEVINSAANQLQTTINDLQDFYDLKNGQLVLKSEPFYLHDCISKVVSFFAPQASAGGLSIAYIINDQVPKELVGDASRLYQILANLLHNALKFTSRGEVILSVNNCLLDNKGYYHLHFAVQDTGIGINSIQIDNLFNMSRSFEAKLSHRYDPKGLGLLLNKELVELMGGQLWVESKAGKGSTFHFTIMVKPAAL